MNIYVEKIIQIANKKKIPLSKICADTNINKNSFNNWKNGAEPPLDKIINIIKYLGLSADEIFDLKENLESEKNIYCVDCNQEQFLKCGEIEDVELRPCDKFFSRITTGKKIKMFRELAGMKQEDLAKQAGIPLGTLQKYEIDSRNPKLEPLKKMADSLSVSVNIFLLDYICCDTEKDVLAIYDFLEENGLVANEDNRKVLCLQENLKLPKKEVIKRKLHDLELYVDKYL